MTTMENRGLTLRRLMSHTREGSIGQGRGGEVILWSIFPRDSDALGLLHRLPKVGLLFYTLAKAQETPISGNGQMSAALEANTRPTRRVTRLLRCVCGGGGG